MVKGIRDARKPSMADVEYHRCIPVPYWNCCTVWVCMCVCVCLCVCVSVCQSQKDGPIPKKCVIEDTDLFFYSFDYCFPGDELGHKLIVSSGL